MEQRYVTRTPVNEQVELWCGYEKYGEFESANMCTGGIFVKNCQNEIGRIKSVTIKFSANPNLSYRASHEALVVHKAIDGVGFRWMPASHV